jgi:SAM-dependent methyltransferase
MIERLKGILRSRRHAYRTSFANAKKISYNDLRAFGRKFAGDQRTLIVYGEFRYHDLLPNCTCLPHLEYDCEAYYPILAGIPDASYPAIVATGLLEHMQDPARLIRECHRILEPGGTLYLSASAVFSVHRGPDDYFHVTQYGMKVLMDACSWQHCDIQGSCQPFKTAAILLQRILLQSETNPLIRPLVYFLVKTLPLLDRFIIRQYADRSFSPSKQIDSMAPSNIQVIAQK